MPDTSAEFSEEIGHRSRDIGGDGCYRISLSQLGNIRQSEEWSVISITRRAYNEYDESEDIKTRMIQKELKNLKQMTNHYL